MCGCIVRMGSFMHTDHCFEVAISMAPEMNQVRVYVSDTTDVSMFNKMASENPAGFLCA
jgi:hypothetical protein